MNIALISSNKNPFLNWYLEKLLYLGIKNIFIIIDKKKFSKKDLNIIKQRLDYKTLRHLKKTKSAKDKFKFKVFDEFDSKKNFNFFKKNKINIFLNAGLVKKINLNFTKKFKVLNAHPGILPYYRGANCPEWSILNNFPIGITIHIMNNKYDSGRIIKIKKINKNFKNYKQFRSHVYEESILFGLNMLKKIQKKPSILKNSKIQEEKKSKFYKPMPKELLKLVKKSFN